MKRFLGAFLSFVFITALSTAAYAAPQEIQGPKEVTQEQWQQQSDNSATKNGKIRIMTVEPLEWSAQSLVATFPGAYGGGFTTLYMRQGVELVNPLGISFIFAVPRSKNDNLEEIIREEFKRYSMSTPHPFEGSPSGNTADLLLRVDATMSGGYFYLVIYYTPLENVVVFKK